MRKNYEQVLQRFFHRKLFYTRVELLDITQKEMAHKLHLSCRSYVDLDHRRASCSAVTLALPLVYICNDPTKFLEELRYAFESVEAKAS